MTALAATREAYAIVRLLEAGEEHVLDSVAPGVFDDPINAEAARAFLADPNHLIVVALKDGIVVGFVSAVQYLHPDKARPELWINEVGVADAHQRRGLARDMINTLLAQAQGAGYSAAWVLTDRQNEAAMGLYASVAGARKPSDHVMFEFDLDTTT